MTRSSNGLRVGTLVLVIALLAVGVSGVAAATRARTRGPAGARFYEPPRVLPAGAHGTLIWQRPYTGVAALAHAHNDRVLYKQVGVKGKLVSVSGLVSIPNGKAPNGGWPVVSFAHGTTGIADVCAPSRAPGPNSDPGRADLGWTALLDGWIKAGFAVVRTDYEGLGTPGAHPFLIGRSEGRGVLDIVRAARQLDPAVSNRLIISGHSQGGQAALWAASLAPKYTPDLHLLGTVAFAPQSHTALETGYLKTVSSTGLTPLGAMILRGIDVAYPSLHERSLLTAAGARLYPQTLTKCLDGLSAPSSFGGLPLDQLVRPSANLAASIRAVAANDPDKLSIRGPILLEQGLADTTVPAILDQALSKSLAKAGDSVTYHTYAGATHSGVLTAAAADATQFMNRHRRR